VIKSIPGISLIQSSCPSLRTIRSTKQPGDQIGLTIDCFTRPGSVQLVGENEEEIQRDWDFIRNLEESHTLWEVFQPETQEEKEDPTSESKGEDGSKSSSNNKFRPALF